VKHSASRAPNAPIRPVDGASYEDAILRSAGGHLDRVVLVTTVTSIETLRRSPRAALFEGRDDIPVSMFITEYDRGEGPDQHLHEL